MSPNTVPSIHWAEGMFLCPQHLQGLSRELDAKIHRATCLGTPGLSGLAELEINEEAVGRDLLDVRRAEVLFADGTWASFPATAVVSQRDFKAQFTGENLDVYLGIPAFQPGVRGLGDPGDERARFHAVSQDLPDENERGELRPVEVRILHGRLFFGDEDRSGFECVRIARLERRGRPEPVSALAIGFIPDALRLSAAPSLVRRLRELSSALRSDTRDLASRLPELAGVAVADRGPELGGLLKLQAMNQCMAPLETVAATTSLHPFWAYMELRRAIGTLSLFGDERVLPELPVYDPLDLHGCFTATLDALRDLISSEGTVPYDSESFIADGARLGLFHCRLPEDWNSAAGRFYLAVDIGVSSAEVDGLVQRGLKLFAEADLERVLLGVLPGIALNYQRNLPHGFRKHPGRHYFLIDTEGSSREAWLRIRKESRASIIWTQPGSSAVFHLFVERR